MKTFVIGDIHGRHKALIEVLNKANFNYEEDKLIVLGDVVDGGEESYEVVEELLKIKNLVYIWGNHDWWFLQFILKNWKGELWLDQGGRNTLSSYHYHGSVFNDIVIPKTHENFFMNGKYFHLENNMLFVHGGFDPNKELNKQTGYELMWDRHLIERYKNGRHADFDKIFVGHTTTQTYDSLEPLKFGSLWMLDTGAGWNGKLTIMDVNTEEYWQSAIQEPADR